ncbi:MAG: sortase domain-containing protein, partial [Actinomycetota bacterium]
MIRKEPWPSNAAGPVSDRPEPRKEGAVRRVGATIGFLADASRRRPAGRRVLWVFVSILGIVGVLLISYPFATQVWAKRIQSSKNKEFAADELLQAYKRNDVKGVVGEGEALTRLRIPKLKVNVIVVEGTSGNALRAGAGHYETSALPGEPSNVAIAGHRT